MANGTDQYADRITQLLTKQKAPNLLDVAIAYKQASIGRTTVGEALNAQKANELAEAKTLYDVLSSERAFKLEQKKYAFEIKKVEQAAEIERKKANRETYSFYWDRMKEMYSGADPKTTFEALRDWGQQGLTEESSPDEFRRAEGIIAQKYGFVPPYEEPDYKVVGSGGALVDAATGQVIYKSPAAGGDLSVNDVIAPLVAKMAAGGALTEGEQSALDYAANLDPFEKLKRDLAKTMTAPETQPTGEEVGAEEAPEEEVPVIQSESEYKALPSGALYREQEGGPIYRKK